MSRAALNRLSEFQPQISKLVLSISIGLHLVALLVFLALPDSARTVDLAIHFSVLVPISLGLSVGAFLVTRANPFRIMEALHLAVATVVAIRFPDVLTIRIVLPLAVVMELSIYERYPVNFFLGSLTGMVVAGGYIWFDLSTGPVLESSWGQVAESLSVLVLLLVSGGLASLLSRYYEEMVAEREQAVRFGEVIEELSENNVRLQQFAFRSQEESRESERNRITSEIHDAVGYTLTNLIMMMEAATDIAQDDPVRLSRLMQNARDQAKSGLDETRRALRELRAQEEELPRGVAAYERLFRAFQGTSSLSIRAEYRNIPMSFGREIDLVVFRFVQEGLTNAVRHGRATEVTVLFWLDGDQLSVTMSDNGVGSKTVEPGIGLAGMRERAQSLAGEVAATPTPNGFEITLRLKVPVSTDG